VTGLPYVPDGAAVVINPVAIIFGATVAAAIVIPMMLIFSWAFEPIIYLNVSRNLLRMFFCWPLWVKQKYFGKPDDAQGSPTAEAAAALARLVDVDGDGKLTAAEITNFKEDLSTDASLAQAMNIADLNHDGNVTEEELDRLLRFHSNEEKRKAEEKIAKVQGVARGVSTRGRLHVERTELQAASKLQMLFRRRRAMQLWALALNHNREDQQAAKLQKAWSRRIARVAHAPPVDGTAGHSPPPSPPGASPTGASPPPSRSILSSPLPPPKKKSGQPQFSRRRVPRPQFSRRRVPRPVHTAVAPSAPEDDKHVERLSSDDARRSYKYDSLNEGLVKASLTESWKKRDWPQLRVVLLGWSISYFFYFTQLFFFQAYGCMLFEASDDPADPPTGNTDEFIIMWIFSAGQRFILHEPMLILAGKGLPILFASEFCANCCGETIVNLLSLIFTIVLEAIKRIKA